MAISVATRRLSIALLFSAVIAAGVVHSDTATFACNGCHGTYGISQANNIPTISGLNFQYFYATMQAFKRDERKSTIMGRIAKGFRTRQLQRLAMTYGRYRWSGNPLMAFDLGLAQRGKAIHEKNCIECHEQNGHFQDKDTPPLAGQAKGYLLNQMRDYRVAATIMPQPPIMQEQLEQLSDEDLIALAEFFSSPLAKPPTVSSER